MSRTQARKDLSFNEFKKEMSDIYTTSAILDTIDEAPMAYKPMEVIVDCIGETAEIISTLTPRYNFKAKD